MIQLLMFTHKTLVLLIHARPKYWQIKHFWFRSSKNEQLKWQMSQNSFKRSLSLNPYPVDRVLDYAIRLN